MENISQKTSWKAIALKPRKITNVHTYMYVMNKNPLLITLFTNITIVFLTHHATEFLFLTGYDSPYCTTLLKPAYILTNSMKLSP
jgi:hypothetical protein